MGGKQSCAELERRNEKCVAPVLRMRNRGLSHSDTQHHQLTHHEDLLSDTARCHSSQYSHQSHLTPSTIPQMLPLRIKEMVQAQELERVL